MPRHAPVLVAAVAIAVAVAVAACGGGAPSTSPTVGNTGPTEPTAPRGLDQVDDASFAALVAGTDWDRVIDGSAGIVELRVVSSARDDAESERWVRRQCGSSAAAAAADRAAIVHRRLTESAEDYPVTCGPKHSRVSCYQGGLGEYDLGIGFEFAQRDGRYHLIGITTIDVGSPYEEEYRMYEAEYGKPDGC